MHTRAVFPGRRLCLHFPITQHCIVVRYCSSVDVWIYVQAKGNAAFSAGKFEEAIDFFTQAIDVDPSNHVFFSNRSACKVCCLEHVAGVLSRASARPSGTEASRQLTQIHRSALSTKLDTNVRPTSQHVRFEGRNEAICMAGPSCCS